MTSQLILKYKEKTDSIRIRHKFLKGIMMILRDRSRPLSNVSKRPVCKICTIPHEYKTYHLKLDDEGCILVSTGIYDHIARMVDKGGFEIANVIHNPPTQIIKAEFVDMKAVSFAPSSMNRGG